MDGGKNTAVQYLVTLAVSLAALTGGVSSTWTTPVIPKFRNNEIDFKLSDSDISWIVATGSIGIMAGSLVTSFVADRYGRRATLVGSSIPFTIGTVVIITTSNVWLICLTRFLWGIGLGMIMTVSNIYIAEIVDKDIRGSTSVMNRVIFNLGSFLSLAIGPFISYNTINYIMLGLPISYFISCCLVPETPYFYLKEGRVDDARKSLIRLRATEDEKVLEEELSMMRSSVNKEMRRSGSAKELFSGKQYRKAVIITAGLRTGQVVSGISVIPHYLGAIMQESNSKINLPTIFIIFGGVRFGLGVISSVIADKVGRRPLLLYSFLGTSLALAIVTVYFFVQEVTSIDKNVLATYAIIVFIGIILNNVTSYLGYHTIINTVVGEIFPMNVKATAMASSNIYGGFIHFFVVKSYQSIKDWSGLFGVFLVFTIGTIMSTVFIYFVVPETKGKSLEEIQVILQGIHYDNTEDKVKDTTKFAEGDSTELKPMIDQTASVNNEKDVR